MSTIRDAQSKYDEVYIGTVRSILCRATKKCAIFVGSISIQTTVGYVACGKTWLKPAWQYLNFDCQPPC